MVEALIFDCDGTLFEIHGYVPAFREVMSQALRALNGNGKDFPMKEGYEPIRLPLEESNRMLRERWGVEPESFWRIVEEIDFERRKEMIDSLFLFPDAEILREIDVRCAILSNTPERIVRMQLERYGISDLFESILCTRYKDKLSKPSPKGLDIVLDRMGLGREDIAYVGDSDVDFELCRRAGVPFIHVRRNGLYDRYMEGSPDFVIKDLYGLKEIVDELRMR